eukprot:TRINITY_DN6604_c0_g1_i1.p1 TRINITY_DN6604_c0_g1~~TRINITY_DN6604_c0_g1_i1.p1  ORF type:complete len:843 (-),score=239.72 TRINITY_DN6604_c0_g1_i1:41-2251(-)
MGSILIHLDSLPFNSTADHWFSVCPTPKCGYTHGQIHIKLTYNTKRPLPANSPWINPKKLGVDPVTLETRKKFFTPTGKSAGCFAGSITYHPPKGSWPGALIVEVKEGKNLIARDANGKSDPYLIVKLGSVEKEGRVIEKTLTPKWHETYYFQVLDSQADEFLVVEVWDSNQVAADSIMGVSVTALQELEPSKTKKSEFEFRLVPNESDYSLKPGQAAAERGFRPHLPVVLLPGFASTSLKVVESPDGKWIEERVWLSLEKIGTAKYRDLENKASQMGKQLVNGLDSLFKNKGKTSQAEAQEEAEEKETAEEAQFKNKWLEHVCLQNDGKSDPPGIKVRAVPGKEGVMYLDPGATTKLLSWVMAPLIKTLEQLGYTDRNLLAAPYDWRVPPYFLEKRDGFFSDLKKQIEDLVQLNDGTPAVLIAHSMGNRTAHYFLNMMRAQPGGEAWLDKHVHTFMAVGAPWLGAPKVVRSLATGERMGMEALIKQKDGVRFARSIGSTPFLLPIGLQYYFDASTSNVNFVYLKKSDKEYVPMDTETFLREVGATNQLDLLKEYQADPYFGGAAGAEAILQPPPVRRLYSIYGINLPTEKAFVYRKTQSGAYELTNGDPKIPGVEFPSINTGGLLKAGIGFETPETPQKCIELMTGVKAPRCGDGTVPYESLNYCLRWAGQIQSLIMEELPRAEHREILNNRAFLSMVVDYVSARKGEKPGWEVKCEQQSYNAALATAVASNVQN